MVTDNVKIYDRYLAAWSAITDAERLDLLKGSVEDDIVFTNPQQTRHGIADLVRHLEMFQQRTPGGAFRMNNMIGWGQNALAEWQMVDGEGNPAFSGYDVVTFRGNLISTILLFSNVEPQKLAWRRRDAVHLETTA